MLRVVCFEVAIYNHINRNEENEVNITCYRKSTVLRNHLLILVSSNLIDSTANGYRIASHAVITQIEKKEREKKNRSKQYTRATLESSFHK